MEEELTTASYQKIVSALTDQGVALTDVNGEFRSTYDIIKDIAAIWDDLTSMEQAGLATTISGTRQQAVFFSLVEQFQEAQGAMDAMANSTGTLQESYDVYLESTTAHINQFKIAFESLGQTMFDSSFLTPIIDLGTAFLEVAEGVMKLINSIGGLNTILIATVGIIATMKLEAIKGFVTSTIPSAIARLTDFAKTMGGATRMVVQFMKTAHTGNVFRDLADGINHVSTALSAQNAAISASQVAFMGLFSALAIGIGIYTTVKRKMQEAREEIERNAESAKKTSDDLETLTARYKALRESGPLTDDMREQAKDIQAEIVDLVGAQARNLDLVNGNLATQLDLLKDISVEESRRAMPDLKAKMDLDAKQFNKGAFAEGMDSGLGGRLPYSQQLEDMLNALGYENEELTNGNGEIELKFNDKNAKEILDALTGVREFLDSKDALVTQLNMDSDGAIETTLEALDSQIDFYTQIVETSKASADEYFKAMAKTELDKRLELLDVHSQEQYDNLLLFAKSNALQKVGSLGEDAVAEYEAVLSELIHEQFPQFIDKSQELAGANTEVVSSVVDATEAMEDLSNAYAALDKARSDMATTGSLTVETIEAIAKENANYIDYLYEENGMIKLNTEEWQKYASTKADAKISELNQDIASKNQRNTNIESKLGEYWNLIDEYDAAKDRLEQTVNEANSIESAKQLTDTLFGNIDLSDARRKITWTKDLIEEYKDALEDWAPDIQPGEMSTVLGAWDSWDDLKIAYTPILVTDDGAELLTADAVYKYIEELIRQAVQMVGEGNPIPASVLLKLDAKGIEIDGKQISNLIAGVYDDEQVADQISKSMHFAGPNGALELDRQAVKDLANDIEEMRKELDLTPAAIEALTEELEKNNEIVQQDTENIQLYQLILEKLQKQQDHSYIDNISQADDGIKRLGQALGDFEENGSLRASDFSGMNELFQSLESYDKFIKVATNAKSTMAEVQAAANELGGEYINSIGILDNLTESNSQVIESLLTSMGVTNAHEVVTERLKVQELEAIFATVDFANASWEDVQAKFQEAGATEDAIAAFQSYEAQSIAAKLATMDLTTETATSVGALLQQAQAAGIACGALARLVKFKQDYVAGDVNFEMVNHAEEIQANMLAAAQREIEEQINDALYNPPKITITVPKVSSGSGSKGSGNKGNGSSKKATEEYIADIDKFREAIERLDRVQLDKERFELHFDNDDLQGQINSMDQYIELEKREQDALVNLVAERKKYITEKVNELRGIGFEIEWDPGNNKLFVKNLEHINELQAKTIGNHEDMQDATNDYRKDYDKLIDEILDYNKEDQENSQAWWENYYSIIEHELERFDKQIELIQGKIDKLNTRAEARSRRADFTSSDPKDLADVKEIFDMYKQIDDALAKEQDLLVQRAQARREQGFTDDDPQIVEDSNKWWELQDERVESMSKYYEDAINQWDNLVQKNDLFMDNMIEKGAKDVSGGLTQQWLDEMNGYYTESENAMRKQQDLIHEYAEYLRSQGFDENSDEIRELTQEWWAKEKEIIESKDKYYESIFSQFDNELDKEEREIDKLAELGSKMGDEGIIGDWVSQMADMRDTYLHNKDLEIKAIEEYIEYLKADNYNDNSERIAELSQMLADKQQEKLDMIEESYEAIFTQYKNGLDSVERTLDNLLEKAASSLQGGIDSSWLNNVHGNIDQAMQYIHNMQYYIDEYINYLKTEEGYDDNSEKIAELTAEWWEYEDKKIEIMTNAYEKIVNQFDNAIENAQRMVNLFMQRSGSDLMNGVAGSTGSIAQYQEEILDYIEQAQKALEDEMGYLLSEGYSEFSEEYAALTDKWYEYEEKKIEVMQSTFKSVLEEYQNGIDKLNKAIAALIPTLHVGLGEEFSSAQLGKIEKYTDMIVDYYEKMKQQAYELIEYYRSLGYSDDSAEISEQIENLYDYEDASRAAMVQKFQALIDHYMNELSYSAMMLTQSLDKATTNLDDTYSGDWYSNTKQYLDEVVAYNRRLQDQQMQLIEYYRSLGYSDSSAEITELVTSWWDEENQIREQVLAAYQSVLDQYQNAIDREQKALEKTFENSGSKEGTALDVESLDAARDQAWQLESYYRTMQDVVSTMADYYRSLGYEENSDEISELTQQWQQYEDEIEKVKESVIDNLHQIVETTNKALSDISGAYDTFKNAANEFAENGGFLSVDTFQSLIELGPQYMQYLQDENGMLVINEAKIQDMIKAKIEQLALDNALTYVERLRMAIMEGSVEDLNNLIFATTATTDATWGLVYANLAMLDLTPEQYEQALHNIDSMRDLANAAAAGVGKVAGEATKNVEEWSNALDDLIKYVIAMLQQRLDDYIESLEDLKDAYEDIIEAKEKELDLTRDEADYADEVADRAKELAKLQAKYEALGLDDSRDAQAQKAKLAEQMADLQDELNKTQRDHAIDYQKESLDKQHEAYVEQKDKEIEEAEEYFSSYQKQYDAAVAYIKEHWSTLLSELMEWNYEYGDVLNQEIVDAWNSCLEAMQNYGWTVDELLTNMKSKLEELKQAQEELNNTVVAGTQNYNEYHQAQQQAIQDQTPQPNDVPDFNPGPSNTPPSHNDGNYVEPEDPYPWRDPDKDYGSHDVPKPSPTPQERPTYPDPEPFYPETESKPEPEPEPDEPERPLAMLEIVKKMAANSEKWRQDSDPVNRAVLEGRNRNLEEQLHPFGVYSKLNTGDGWWYITRDDMNPEFVGKKLYDCYYGVYHTGGIAGIGPLKNDEVLAKLQKGEVIISNQDKGSLYGLIDFVSKLNNAMDAKFTSNAVDLMSNVNSMMDNSRNEKITPNGPVITFGDMYITGTNEETVKAHKEINRKFTNEILKYLDLKR